MRNRSWLGVLLTALAVAHGFFTAPYAKPRLLLSTRTISPVLASRERSSAEEDGYAMQPVRSKTEIAAFGIPVSAIFLSNFALGAIDTAAVGHYGGLVDLAALAPGVSSVEYASYCLASITAVIFNRLSTIFARGETADGKPIDMDTWNAYLGPALGLAFILGLLQAGAFAIFSKQIALVCGAPPEFVGRTASYLLCRSFGAATYLYSSVASSAFYATKDSRTPFIGTMVAVVLNIFGDVALCPRLGIVGAALATSLAQIGSAVYLRSQLEARGLAPKTERLVLPSPSRALSTLRSSAPFSAVVLARTLFYLLVNRWVCLLGVTASCAQQITSTIFWGSSSASAEPMSVSAQTFVPEQASAIRQAAAAMKHKPEPQLKRAVGRMATTLRRLYTVSALWSGAVTAVIYFCLTPSCLKFLTSDVGVIGAVPRAPLLTLSMLVAPMLLSEGACLGLGTVTNALMRWMAVCASTCIGVGMYLLNRPSGYTIATMWWTVALFIFVRFLGNAALLMHETLFVESWCSNDGKGSELCELPRT
jgi:hypothetical protein